MSHYLARGEEAEMHTSALCLRFNISIHSQAPLDNASSVCSPKRHPFFQKLSLTVWTVILPMGTTFPLLSRSFSGPLSLRLLPIQRWAMRGEEKTTSCQPQLSQCLILSLSVWTETELMHVKYPVQVWSRRPRNRLLSSCSLCNSATLGK